MKSLLIVAHGSRRQASNDEVRQLAECISKQTEEFDFVHSGFLELADPSIPQGLEDCIAKGAKEVVVMPYFLAAGRHVVEDIPAEVDPIIEKYPQIQITITPHLGHLQIMPQAIMHLAGETKF